MLRLKLILFMERSLGTVPDNVETEADPVDGAIIGYWYLIMLRLKLILLIERSLGT